MQLTTVSSIILKLGGFMSLDWSILYFIQDQLRSPFGDWIIPKITMLGDLGLIWIIFALILIFTKKYRIHGIVMLAALGIGVLIGNVALKNIVERSRPCWIDTSISMLIPIPEDFSFPSGHTLASVIGATCLTITNRKFGWFAIPLAVLIAFSRLYLFVHFPSDIFASTVIGIIIAIATMKYLYQPVADKYNLIASKHSKD